MSKTTLKIINEHTGHIISDRCVWANDSWSRMIGLLKHDSLGAHESLLIEPCKQVHTLFMRFPIDVVFLDKNNTVLDICSMKPWRLSPLRMKASKVLELPEGHCQKVGLEKGQSLKMLSEAHDA